MEADSNLERAEKAEAEMKTFNEKLASKDTIIKDLSNKISLLQGELDRSEKRAQEVTVAKIESGQEEGI